MDSVTALNADVVWHANTGKAEVDIERLRRQFHEATDSMSTQALRASAAQDRLDRALIKHGPASERAKTAEAALRREIEASTVAAGHHSSALGREERSVERLGRGAIVGSGAIRGLARAAVFASTSFVGGFGLAFAIRTVITEASRHQIVINQTRQALERQGVSWEKNRAQIDETIQAQSKLSAFEDEQLYPSFTALFRRTGDVNQALKLNALAADVARGRNVDLNTAVTLVTRASIGQIGSLRRLGIDAATVTTNVDKLKASTTNVTKAQLDAAKAADKQATQTSIQALLLAKYGGSAKAFGDSAAGAQAKFTNALHDSGEVIGRDLLPEGTKLLKQGTAYLDQLNRSGRLQHDVNVVMHDGGRIVRGFGEALHVIREVAVPVVDALGGVEKTAKLMLEAFAAYKLIKIAGAIRGIGLSWRFVGREATIAAGAERAAATGGAAGVAGAAAFPLGLAAADVLALYTAGAETHPTRGDPHLGQSVGSKFPILDKIGHDSNFPNSIRAAARGSATYIYGLYRRGILTAAQAERALQNLDPYGTFGSRRAGQSTADRQPGRSPGGAGAPGLGGSSLSSQPPRPPVLHEFALPQRFVIAEARVQAEGTEADQLSVYRQELAYVRAQIASGKLTKKSLADAYNEETQLDGQIKQITDAAEARRKAAAAKRKAEEERRHRAYLDEVHATEQRLRTRSADARGAAVKPAEDALIAFYRREALDVQLTRTERAHFGDLVQKEREADLKRARSDREQALRNAVARAQLTEHTLSDDRRADQALITFYRKEEHDKSLTRSELLQIEAKRIAAQKALAALGKKKPSGVDFFSEAAANFRTYGSNVGDVLSGQDARGLLARIALTLEENTRHAKSTATTNKQIVKSGPHPAKTAAALADVGAWTH